MMNKKRIALLVMESLNDDDRILYHGTSGSAFKSFDPKKALSGYGLDKHGFGYYLTNSLDIAKFYAQEVSLGEKKPVVLSFKLRSDATIVDEDEQIGDPEGILGALVDVCGDELEEEEAKDVLGLSDGYYGDHPSYASFIDWAKYCLGGQKEVSDFLSKMGIDGLFYRATENGMNGTNYVIFDTRSLIFLREM